MSQLSRRPIKSCFFLFGSGSGIGSPPPNGISEPCIMTLPCTSQNKENNDACKSNEAAHLTLRNHPIGVNQTTCDERNWAALARCRPTVLLLKFLPPPGVGPGGAEGQHRRRFYLPERRRDSRNGRLHLLRQPQLQPESKTAPRRH